MNIVNFPIQSLWCVNYLVLSTINKDKYGDEYFLSNRFHAQLQKEPFFIGHKWPIFIYADWQKFCSANKYCTSYCELRNKHPGNGNIVSSARLFYVMGGLIILANKLAWFKLNMLVGILKKLGILPIFPLSFNYFCLHWCKLRKIYINLLRLHHRCLIGSEIYQWYW